MKTKTPDSIKNGHDNLCLELKEIIALGGNIGEKAQLLNNVMIAHFQKEEKYAFPPLGLLLALSEGHWELDADEAIKISENLKSKLLDLKSEHENISEALHNLRTVANEENNPKVKQFIKDLMIHIDIEDQVLYPATILIGNYLKHMKNYNHQ